MSKIIIDGVNVAECEQRFGDSKCALLDQYFCENNPDCYYKQLKCLQTENEELKKEIDKLGIKHENYCNILYWDMKNQYDRYKVALEEIKKIVDEETNTDKLLHYKELSHYKNYCAILDIIQEVLK